LGLWGLVLLVCLLWGGIIPIFKEIYKPAKGKYNTHIMNTLISILLKRERKREI